MKLNKTKIKGIIKIATFSILVSAWVSDIMLFAALTSPFFSSSSS
jgi:hypothetical protein